MQHKEFFALLAFFAITTLYKVNIKSAFPKITGFRKMILTTLGCFILFKIATTIYLKIAVVAFGFNIEDITAHSNILFASKDDILGLINNYGGLTTMLIIGIAVPIYEELIFRGVILESSKQYLKFNWANVFQAFLFSAIHGSLSLFPVFFGFGMLVSILNRKFGGLYPGIVFHIINNVLIMALFLSRI